MPLTGKEMLKLALSSGWEEVRVTGSHHHLKKAGVDDLMTIPVHGNNDLARGLEKKLLKQLGYK
jgi:predicted RNA binding protein YcfA (HicA-like mRNA interferase family)